MVDNFVKWFRRKIFLEMTGSLVIHLFINFYSWKWQVWVSGRLLSNNETVLPGVNFTTILWAAFAPNSFRQKITNPNCKHIKGAQRTLLWKSCLYNIGEIDSHTKVIYTDFKCLQFGFVIFWRKEFVTKAAHKMLVKLTPLNRLVVSRNLLPILLSKIL